MKIKLILLLIQIALFSNCAMNGPVGGVFFTKVKYAGHYNTNSEVVATKTAEGCSSSVLGLFAWGDAGAGQIAFKNKIERISTIDHSTTYLLYGLYRDYCTIISGEGK